MPRIPTHTAKIVPRGPRGAPISPAAARTGEEAVGAGLAAIGKGLQDVGGVLGELAIRKQRLQGYRASMEIDALHRATLDNIDADFKGQQDTSQWPQISEARWSAFEKDVQERLYPTLSEEQQGRLNSQLAAWKTRLDANVRVKATGKYVEDSLAIAETGVKEAVKNGNSEEIKRAIDGFKANAHEWFPPAKDGVDLAEERLKELLREGMIDAVENSMVQDLEGTEALLSAELEARRGGVKLPGKFAEELREYLPEDKDVAALAETASRKLRRKSTAQEKQYEDAGAEYEKEWLQKWRDGTLTEDEILQADWGITDPELLRKSIDIKLEWLNRIDRSPETSNAQIDRLVSALVYDKSDEMSAAQIKKLRRRIYSHVLRGDIDAKRAEKFALHLDEVAKGTNNRVVAMEKRYQSTLLKLWDGGVIESGIEYNKLANRISEFYAQNPDASSQEGEAFWKELRESIKKKWYKNILGFTWRNITAPKRYTHEILGIGVTREPVAKTMIGGMPEPQTQKEFIEQLSILKGRDDNMESAWAYYNKWKDKWP